MGRCVLARLRREGGASASRGVIFSHPAKAEKITAVLVFAQNKVDQGGKIAVTSAEIRGCTGVSRRYAYDLVGAITADVLGVKVRESKQVQTAKGTKRKQKALLVDCEPVHRLDEGVKSFTIPNGGDGEV